MAPENKLSVYIRYFLLFFLTFLFVPDFFYRAPETGLDPSWNIAVYLARKQGMIFGRDFVFTYGPLSIFQGRLPIGVNKYIYLLFDGYLVLSFFLMLRKVFSKDFSYGLAGFTFLAVITAMYRSELVWLFSLFLFNLFTSLGESKRKLYLVQAAILSILCFYFKMNLGLVTIVFFVAGIVFSFFRKKLPLVFCIVTLLLYFLVIWLSALVLHVDLPGYITGSLEIVSGYNDAMFKGLDNGETRFLVAALITIFLMACWFLYRFIVIIKEKQWAASADELFIYAITAASVFIVFKSAFVRADASTHLYFYFKSIGLIGALLYLFSPKMPSRRMATLCSWLVLVIGFWGLNTLPGNFQPWRSRIINLGFLPLKFKEVGRYWRAFANYDSAMAASDTLGQHPGNEYKAVIGNHTADIIPTEIATLYFNGIRYDPRPVMQSYSAYNRYLDSLNWRKYVSPDAPDYILFSVDAIDGRYPFFDETRTKLAILGNYSVAGEIKSDLVLKRKQPAELLPVREHTTVFKLGQEVEIPKSADLQVSRIFVKYNWWGQLCRLFYQPPSLKITFTLEDGETKTWRAIVPILADGVILNKYLETEKEFQLLMQANGRLNTDIRKIRLEADSSGGFTPEIKMVSTWYAMPKKSPAEEEQDSLGVVKLLEQYNSYIPVPLDTTGIQTDSILCGVGNFATYSPVFTVDGWAYRVRANNDHIRVNGVLKCGDRLLVLPTAHQGRLDLTIIFNRTDLFDVGFKSTVSKSRLAPGDYQFGVLLVDSVSGKKWIQYTNQQLFIQSEYRLTRIKPVAETSGTHHKMESALNPLEYTDNGVQISGWAFVRDITPGTTRTKLILQSPEASFVTNIDSIRRPDVSGLFKDPGLEYCGFSAVIKEDQLPKGQYKIGIEEVMPGGKDSCIHFTGEQLSLGKPTVALPVLVTDLPPAADCPQGTDFVKEENDMLLVSGWAVQKTDQVRNSSVDIVLKSDKAVYAAGSERKARPDVMAFFRNKLDTDSCGFFARIPENTLPAGKYEVGIHIYSKGDKGIVKFIGQSIIIN